MRTVDITPTWRGVLPLLLAVYTDGNAKGRADALAELYRLCDIADELIADQKAATTPTPRLTKEPKEIAP